MNNAQSEKLAKSATLSESPKKTGTSPKKKETPTPASAPIIFTERVQGNVDMAFVLSKVKKFI